MTNGITRIHTKRPRCCTHSLRWTALCGFRPLTETVDYLCELVPHQFSRIFPFLIGVAERAAEYEDIDEQNTLTARFFSTLYQLEQERLQVLIAELKDSLTKGSPALETPDGRFLTPKGIALACMEEYPQDPGLFAPFFLNVMHLVPNEAVFLEPRTLHRIRARQWHRVDEQTQTMCFGADSPTRRSMFPNCFPYFPFRDTLPRPVLKRGILTVE